MDGVRGIAFARARVLMNTIAGIRNEPLIKVVFITTLTTALWFGTLYLFHYGLSFFYGFPIIGPALMDEAMYIFFAVLFIMLMLSALIVSHSTLFNSAEVEFLFSKPMNHRIIYIYRLLQTGVFSSWAFLFLGLPLLIAYALIKGVSAWFYLALPAWFAMFVILPTALACLAVLVMVRFFKYERLKYYFIAIMAITFMALYWYYKTAIAPEARAGGDIAHFMDTFLYHLRILKHPFFPGYWMASSIVKAGSGLAPQSWSYVFAYGATALVALQLNWLASGALFHRGWLKSRNRSNRAISHPDNGATNRLLGYLSFLPRPTAALIVKDVRIFARDFNQYSQFLIYLAILGVYIFNLRNIPASVDNPYWKMIVVFLNLSATSLVLAGFTVRFLFPQISLEGNKIWMLGLAPITFRKLVLQKFFLNFIPVLLISEALMVSTNLMLSTPPGLFFISCSVAAMSSGGLVGLALGLGSLYPNFREDNPARIVSGFGGTLNFVIALGYVMLMIIVFAFPYFAYEIHYNITKQTFSFLLSGAWATAVLATAAAGILPMIAGYRKLHRMEF
ncbi:MAG: hypothetical protein PHU03_04885 [Syntrophales bacterium]|nr:hypothetical protein [Syntrophales bacterium]